MDTEDLTSRVEEWSTQLQDEVDRDKATSEAVNTFMVVAAFIAGVQAQVLAITIGLPRSVLQRTTNVFAFLGLIFEIAGTFLGAVHSIRLQRRSTTKSQRLKRVTLFKADLNIILKWYTQKLLKQRAKEAGEDDDEDGAKKKSEDGQSTAISMFGNIENLNIRGSNIAFHNTQLPQPIGNQSDSEDRKERLRRVATFFQELRSHPISYSQEYIIRAVLDILHETSLELDSFAETNDIQRQPTRLILDRVPSVIRPMFTFGNMPLISMGIGVAFLAVSTILLAAASQLIDSVVWIACTSVLLVVMALSVLPFIPWMIWETLSYLKPKRNL